MFSPEIVCSEEFLDMPHSSQSLYFHLAMRADDDGFIQPKLVMRLINSSADDLKVLLTKRFLLSFDTGVVVIKHWLIHNMIRQDRYKPTRFHNEKKSLTIKENNAYTDNFEAVATKWQPNGNQPAPQVRLGKVSIGKEREKPNGFTSISYLKNIPLDDTKEFLLITTANENQIKLKGEALFDYCESKGKRYKNYKAFLRNALRKDYPPAQKKDTLHEFDDFVLR
jgi:hypothetical protein